MKSKIQTLNFFHLEGALKPFIVFFNALQKRPRKKKPVSEAVGKCKGWFNRASFSKPREIC